MARSKQKNNPLIFEELEPRLLFSADGVEALAADAVEQTLEEQPIIIIEQGTQEQAVEPESVQSESADVQPDSGQDETNGGDENTSEQEVTDEQNDEAVVDGGETPASENDASSDAVTDSQPEVQSSELVLINGDVNDYEQLVTDIEQSDDRTRSIEVVVLDNEKDGIDQVTTLLADYHNLDAIHIITNGDEGQIILGSSLLDTESIQENRDSLTTWSESLDEDGDILFYGSNAAGGSEGDLLLTALSETIGCDVAASDDVTGYLSQGGNWDLESERGTVETTSVLVDQQAGTWQQTLDRQTLEANYLSTPLAFEQNFGQTDDSVDFLARGSGYTVFLTDGDAVMVLSGGDSQHVVRLDLVGANTDLNVIGQDELASSSNYLIGKDETNWQTNVDNFAGVYYKNVYEGIDLRYYGNQRQLEYDFVVAAGSNPDEIQLNFDGVPTPRLPRVANCAWC